MGGSQSAPIQTVVREEPQPTNASDSGLSLSQSENCNGCQLSIDTTNSTSSVSLKREQGSVTLAQCDSYTKYYDQTVARTMSWSQFSENLHAGKYWARTTNTPAGIFCEQLSISDANKDTIVAAGGGYKDTMLIRGRVARAGTSYSEGTKAKIIPSISIPMTFAAKKATVDSKGKRVYQSVDVSFTVTQMTLYHPSPIRVDGVQADAMLSLNDPSDPAAKYIVLIPLRGSNSAQPSTEFFSKIAPRLLAIQQPNPVTGEYAATTIPTGNDWALQKLFTVAGGSGVSKVKNGFFTWTAVSEYEQYNKGTVREGNKYVTTMGWRQKDGMSAPQYVMLDTPLDIRTEDLAALTQSLPVTPPAEAIHPIPGQANMVYHKTSEAPAPDTLSGKSACAFPNLCEGFTTGTLDQSVLNSCPGAKCDPFLQNAMLSQDTSNQYFTARGLFSFFLQFLVFVAMLLGAYLALRMVSEDYDLSVRNFAEKMGRVLAVWTKGAVAKVQSARSALSGLGGLGNIGKGGLGGLAGNLQSAAQGRAEGFVEQAKSTAAAAVSKKGEGIMGELDQALGSKGKALASSLKEQGNAVASSLDSTPRRLNYYGEEY